MEQKERKLRWMRLDNAALIFPAALRKHWSNAYRISFTLTDPIDPAVLQEALDRTAVRFPSVCVRLRRSTFWYYLEELPEAPSVRADSCQPLVRMTRAEIRRCAFRVLYYRNRLAVEYFHAVTDGTGGLVFAKNLCAEYIRLRYEIGVPCEEGIKDLSEAPRRSELEDSFRKHAGPVPAPRDSLRVYRPQGTPEPDRFLHVTLGILDADKVLSLARAEGVTVTAYLTALLIDSLAEMQAREVPQRKKRRSLKVQIPVDLRRLYGGDTMRNFVAVANVGVDPRLGDYELSELVQIVHHQMQLAITPKNMAAIFSPNVRDELNPFLKVVPLFLKNPIMRLVFDRVGENVSCMTLSNLGKVRVPAAMEPFIERVEFVLGPQSSCPYNVSLTGWKDRLYLNIVRNTVEPALEELLLTRLVKLGVHVKVESNLR